MSTSAQSAGTFTFIRRFATTTVGMKMLMAVSGVVWVGFVLGHMVGNSQIFLPMPADGGLHPLNAYARLLHSSGGLLWAVRTVVGVALLTHMVSAVWLNSLNNAARPVQYRVKKNIQASQTSYFMFITGLAVAAFVIYHLAHFTWGWIGADAAALTTADGHKDVYGMVIAGFKQPAVAALYVVANLLVGLHLHHAVSSMVQTLGLRTPRYAPLVDKLGPAVAAIVIVGNLSMPLAVWFGVVGS